MGKTVTKSFNGENLQQRTKLTIDFMIPRGCLPLPQGNILVYDHHFQTSSKFNVEPPWEGGTKVYINGPGHMTKMAPMPIFGKNL